MSYLSLIYPRSNSHELCINCKTPAEKTFLNFSQANRSKFIVPLNAQCGGNSMMEKILKKIFDEFIFGFERMLF